MEKIVQIAVGEESVGEISFTTLFALSNFGIIYVRKTGRDGSCWEPIEPPHFPEPEHVPLPYPAGYGSKVDG